MLGLGPWPWQGMFRPHHSLGGAGALCEEWRAGVLLGLAETLAVSMSSFF